MELIVRLVSATLRVSAARQKQQGKGFQKTHSLMRVRLSRNWKVRNREIGKGPLAALVRLLFHLLFRFVLFYRKMTSGDAAIVDVISKYEAGSDSGEKTGQQKESHKIASNRGKTSLSSTTIMHRYHRPRLVATRA